MLEQLPSTPLLKIHSSLLLQLLEAKSAQEGRKLLNNELLFSQLLAEDPFPEHNLHKISCSFLDALAVIGTTIDIWWAITDLGSISLTLFPTLAFGVAVNAAVIGGIFCFLSYKKRLKEANHAREKHQLIAIQQQAANTFLWQKEWKYVSTPNESLTFSSSFIDNFLFSFSFTAMIFVSYFWGLSVLIGLSFASIGTSGLMIAASISLAIGFYAAFIYQERQSNITRMESYQQTSSTIIAEKKGACHLLDAQLENGRELKPSSSSHFRFFGKAKNLASLENPLVARLVPQVE